ncbi:MAG: ComF family protein [Gemmatimonadetes bacterium]|nr:ComF family protein [Gemmatimonadota bacterium]MBL0180715.1 ComF family protein [Gemmatimonadota bacterium]
MVAWAEMARRAERWLLPSECLVCQQRVVEPDEPLVCAGCRVQWRALPDPRCAICGEPSPLGLACRLCPQWPAGIGPVQSAVFLDDRLRPLVHRFKYLGWWRLADAFAVRMAPLLVGRPDADLVPIPLAAGRRRKRGYNQAEVLALALGRRSGRPVCPERLVRCRETPTQTRLTPEARLANLAEAFGAIPSARGVILVDDVFTTGATLVSAAGALLEAGAPQVEAITFARAEPPLVGAAARLRPLTHSRWSEEPV